MKEKGQIRIKKKGPIRMKEQIVNQIEIINPKTKNQSQIPYECQGRDDGTNAPGTTNSWQKQTG